jgi:hypothetical protein
VVRLFIESDQGLTWVFAPSGYLNSSHHSLFNCRNYVALSVVMGMVPLDSKSISRTG